MCNAHMRLQSSLWSQGTRSVLICCARGSSWFCSCTGREILATCSTCSTLLYCSREMQCQDPPGHPPVRLRYFKLSVAAQEPPFMLLDSHVRKCVYCLYTDKYELCTHGGLLYNCPASYQPVPARQSACRPVVAHSAASQHPVAGILARFALRRCSHHKRASLRTSVCYGQ